MKHCSLVFTFTIAKYETNGDWLIKALLKLHQLICIVQAIGIMPVSSPEGGTLCSCTHVPFLLNSLLKMPSLPFVFDTNETTVN